jgi:hypothetical protein
MTTVVTLSYEDAFDDYEKVNIKELLAGIPSKNVLQIAGHFSAQIHTSSKDKELQLKFLKMWVERIPLIYRARLSYAISLIEGRPASKLNFINNVSTSMLSEYALENNNDLAMVDNLTPEQELNLLKTYLYCTKQWLDKQSFKDEDGTTAFGLSKLLIKLKIPYEEIQRLKDFRIQFLKAVFFFKFCEGNPVFSEFLQVFYKEHNVATWNEYLSKLLGIYVRKFEDMKTSSILKVGDDHKEIQDFLRQFALDPQGFKRSDDFLGLREKPVLEIAPNEFLFINLNFIVDKFFQGIQFALAKAIIKHKVQYRGKEIQRFDQFKSIYGEEVSEKGVFYAIMNYTFENTKYSRLNGQELKLKLKSGEPDYYLRHDKNVVLIEYKDILINASVKHSYNFDTIKDEIFKKLISNQNSTDKGISQLVNSIVRIQKGDYSQVDPNIDSNSIIYPVLVITDDSFDLPGVNYILNIEFRRLLKERNISDSNIRNLVIVNLNDLLRFQDFFRNGNLNLMNCLEEYVKMSSNPATMDEAIAAFEEFMKFKTRQEKNFTPEMLLKEVKGMLRE